ncbi:MAG: CoA-binding protein [Thermodesulfobacteriota bacterium]
MDIGNEMPVRNASAEEIEAILKRYKTVAVVGVSHKPERDSHKVAAYLQAAGYRMVPIHPLRKEVLGRTVYPDLMSVPFPVEIVNIFRRPDAVEPVVDQAIAAGARVVWMQLGIVNHRAAQKAAAAGLGVIMDKCIQVEHMKMVSQGNPD